MLGVIILRDFMLIVIMTSVVGPKVIAPLGMMTITAFGPFWAVLGRVSLPQSVRSPLWFWAHSTDSWMGATTFCITALGIMTLGITDKKCDASA